MASPKSGWKKGLLVVAVVSISAFLFVIVGAGMVLLWAMSTADSLGEPTAESVTRTIGVAESSQPDASGGVSGEVDSATGPLRLTIELQDGTFEIRPGPPGSDVTVDGEYAAPYYELVEEHDIDRDGRRTTLVALRPTSSMLVRMVATLRSHGEIPNDLTVTIPEDVPIELELSLSAGKTRTDLGGLTLVDLRADLSMGEHHLDFSRPLAAQLARVQVSGSMGDVHLENLGNARALEFETSSSMGNFNIDLAGDWPVETVAELVFNHTMGELSVNVPESVQIATDSESSVRLGDGGELGQVKGDADATTPVVRLHISTTMGETRFRRY